MNPFPVESGGPSSGAGSASHGRRATADRYGEEVWEALLQSGSAFHAEEFKIFNSLTNEELEHAGV